MSRKYRLSPSTIYKIKNMSSSDVEKGPVKNFVYLKNNEKQKLLRALQEIVINSIYPINAI